MKSSFLKKIIASGVVFSLTLCIGMGLSKQNVAQSYDWDDYYDDYYENYYGHDYDDFGYDYYDVEIFKGNISVVGTTNYFGRPAVQLDIPKGMRIKDIDVDNEPHDHIDEAIVGNKIVIYGLRNGRTYRNLILKIEDFSGIEYKYVINPFTVGGSLENFEGNNGVVAPQIPNFPNVNNANVSELNSYLKNVYRNVFNREVDNSGLQYWSNSLASGQIELEDFFKNLLSESEFMQVAPQVEDKIRKLYRGIFQREADENGFRFWVNRYKQELIDEHGNTREALRDVIDEMTDGQEFRELLFKLGLRLD